MIIRRKKERKYVLIMTVFQRFPSKYPREAFISGTLEIYTSPKCAVRHLGTGQLLENICDKGISLFLDFFQFVNLFIRCFRSFFRSFS